MARRPPYAVTYGHNLTGGHVTPRHYPAILLDWRWHEIRPGIVDWYGLLIYAEPETLNPMVPFEMRCRWVPSIDIRPVSEAVAWMRDVPPSEPD